MKRTKKSLAQEEVLFLVDGTDRSLQFTKQGLSMKETVQLILCVLDESLLILRESCIFLPLPEKDSAANWPNIDSFLLAM